MFRAALAQLVEHIIRNDGVACSSHASGTKNSLKFKRLMTLWQAHLRNAIFAEPLWNRTEKCSHIAQTYLFASQSVYVLTMNKRADLILRITFILFPSVVIAGIIAKAFGLDR